MPNKNEPDGAQSNHTVGYRKPPQGTRFKKGQSGNPKGRPRGSENLATLLIKAVNEPVTVHENGRRKTIPKLEAAIKQLANKAASGDPRATQLLMQVMETAEDRSDMPTQTEAVDETDRIIITQFVSRLNYMGGGCSGGNSDPS
jgi:hypothetical protein